MSMQEKQGYLSDLTDKSKPELQELLVRQQKVAANVKFLANLPDKGAKIHDMIAKIENLLEHEAKVDQTADMFEQMALQAEQTRASRTRDIQRQDEDFDEKDIELLKTIAHRSQDNKMVHDERQPEHQQPKFINSYEKVIKQAERKQKKHPKRKFMPNSSIRSKDVQELSTNSDITPPTQRDVVMIDDHTSQTGDVLHQTEPESIAGPSGDVHLVEMSERIASSSPSGDQQTSQTEGVSQKISSQTEGVSQKISSQTEGVSQKISSQTESVSQKISPHQTFHVSPTASLGDKNPADRSSHPSHKHDKLKHNYDEALNTHLLYIGQSRHDSAKMISVEESVSLQQEQKHKLDKFQAKYAAEKLAERLGGKMMYFDPDGAGRMAGLNKYRDTGQEAGSDDSDDAEDELDYPD